MPNAAVIFLSLLSYSAAGVLRSLIFPGLFLWSCNKGLKDRMERELKAEKRKEERHEEERHDERISSS